jgi:ligand-binding sensor domain-containing protein/two-component sensor histidine kinase
MRCVFVAISLFFTASMYGQPLLFENYSSEQGLSQNSCYTIAQDANGFMWFGTQDGLNRYDGKQFKVFLPQNNIGKKLPSNYITNLFFDRKKNLLWVGTLSGMCLYDPRRDSLVSVAALFPFAARLEKLAVKKIISFKENEYWFITYNNGLVLLNTTSQTITSFFDDAINKTRVNSLVLHNEKIIVALTQNLFYLLQDGNSYKTKPLVTSLPIPEIKELFSYRQALWIGTLTQGCFFINDPLADSSVIKPLKINTGGIGCFTTDDEGALWIGTRGNGIFQYEPDKGLLQTAAHNRYDSRSPGKNFVLCMFKDRQGIIWCGLSGSGLAKYDPLKYQFSAIGNEPLNDASLPDNMVFDIFKSRDGSFFVGTQNKGIAQWDLSANSFQPYIASSKLGLINNTIYDITEDNKSNLWIASWGGLMQLNRKTNKISYKENNELLTTKKLYGVVKLKNADSLLITGENGPVFFSLKDQRWKPFPTHLPWTTAYLGRYMYEGENNILWICTLGAGLIKYDYRKSTFDIIEPVKKYSIYVRHLLQERDLFWLATDNGIMLYDFKKNIVVKHFTLSTQNISNVCYAIQKDNKGFFWVSTNNGLYRIDPQNFSIQNYNIGNGLSFLEYNTACVFKEANGALLFGGVGGITLFNPSQLKENTFSPYPIITAVNVNDSAWSLTSQATKNGHFTFNHRQNFITLFFAVNNFSNQNNNQFTYRLQGLSENWINVGNRNFANYTSLPPGNYIFQLRSANSDGKWCEGMTTFSFSITAPWWQTWWFMTIAFFLLVGLLTYFVRRRIQVISREANLKQKIAEAEMMGLRAQMNPHFIFNSLNSIREMILHNENKEASHFLSKFAHLIRITLNQSGQSFISLRNTIDYLHRYVEMEQVRNADFTCRILADDELDMDETVLPPMLIQPFVENAIWHGITGKKKNINITIDFKKENKELACIIADNGIGINQSLKNKKTETDLHQSVGIENINNRIRLLNEKYNLKSSITIQDKSTISNTEGSGTIVTLRIPLEIYQS